VQSHFKSSSQITSRKKELSLMVFSSISLRSLTFGVVLAASTGFAFASAHPFYPMPQVPGSKVVASVRPVYPMPQVPGSKIVASARPVYPMPQVPGSKVVEPSIAG
jgi:hypothetical protein